MNIMFTFLMVKKLCPYFEKIKFVCKLMHFEHDDAENVATRRYTKTNEFYLNASDKGICHCGVRGEERSTIIYNCIYARAYDIVVEVLALRYNSLIKTFC